MADYLYFDHAAATSVRPEAWAALHALQTQALGNPSSVHAPGRQARALIDQARIDLAQHFLATPEELIFTSGATEALHTAIIGAYLARSCQRPAGREGVVYTSPLVHAAVWSALEFLTTQHGVTVKFLPITPDGHLDLNALTDEQIGEADLIVLEHLNSEIGVLQPAAKLGKKLLRWAEEKAQPKPTLVVDAAASVVSERVGLDFQKCDLLALSGEKFGGLSGSGVLLKAKSQPLTPLLSGSQEWGWRGGTENLVGAVTLNAAYTAHLAEQKALKNRLDAFWQQLYDFFTQHYPNIKITTPVNQRGGHIFHILLPTETPAHLLVAQADLAGLALSAGSACSSGSTAASTVLLNLGCSKTEALRGLRVSFGWDTTEKNLQALKTKFKELL